MWDTSKWHLLDAGRFQYVENDWQVGGLFKHPVNFNRYAIWMVLKRTSDGAQVVVISTHQMTNPQKWRNRGGHTSAIPGVPNATRVQQYAYGMKLLRAAIVKLAAYGPVLVAGDMNTHPDQGGWSAVPQMGKIGFGQTNDGAVVYNFFPHGVTPVRSSFVQVSSDHGGKALVSRFDMGGVGANAVSGTPWSGGSSDGGGVLQASTGGGCCGGGAGVGTVNIVPAADTNEGCPSSSVPNVAGFDAEQMQDAAAVVAAGKALSVPPRGITIGLMTAYGESKLKNINYGDRDSIGIFQQRGNGAWGTTADRMNPTTAASNFFKKLLHVPGWQAMVPTLAAHAVQINADPYYYAPYWPVGLKLQAALQGVEAAALANPTAVTCPPPTGGGTSAVAFTASGVPYVGQFDPSQLMARAQAYVAAGGSDPYFHSVHGSWERLCQHFAANLSGRQSTSIAGTITAYDVWTHFVSTGAAHPATGPDGQSPPVGAWVYFKGTSSAGHVVVYLGNGMAASTDLPTVGRVGIVPADAPVTQWHQTYLGWAAPWAVAGTESKAAA